MLDFTPKPVNCFNDFIELYYTECVKKFPKIQAIAGKWRFEDLIPGLSDFDARFVCADDMTDEDWCKMSTSVGEVHLDLCRSHPEWARILEHLPGVNLTWSELTDDFSYYTEYRQWSYYNCSNNQKLENAQELLAKRSWDNRDEYFFLKKFFTFYGRYDRNIDPVINVGLFENKYPLHSRLMHYFTPPVQAAVSIIVKRPIKGKFEALRIAKQLFPDLSIFDEIFSIVDKHYEIPEMYEEPELVALEERLFKALQFILEQLKQYITIIAIEKLEAESSIRKALGEVTLPPQLKVLDSSRFCRLFKGRMNFYANAPGHFQNIWLIQNELARVGDMFYRTPYKIYWQVIHKERIDNPDLIVPCLVPSVLTESEANATLAFSSLVPGKWENGKEIEISLNIANVFDDFFFGLNKIKRQLDQELRQM